MNEIDDPHYIDHELQDMIDAARAALPPIHELAIGPADQLIRRSPHMPELKAGWRKASEGDIARKLAERFNVELT